MALTILTDRADNGNKFLCLTCRNGSVRSGTGKQMDVCCNIPGGYAPHPMKGKITYVVTQCTAFVPKSPWENIKPPLENLKKQAWRFVASKERQGEIVLIDQAEFQRRVKDGEEYDD